MKITKAKLLSKIEDDLKKRYNLDGEVWITSSTSHIRTNDFDPKDTILYNNFVINSKISFSGLMEAIREDNRTYGVPVLDEVVQIVAQSIALSSGYYFDDSGVMRKKNASDNHIENKGKSLDEIIAPLIELQSDNKSYKKMMRSR